MAPVHADGKIRILFVFFVAQSNCSRGRRPRECQIHTGLDAAGYSMDWAVAAGADRGEEKSK